MKLIKRVTIEYYEDWSHGDLWPKIPVLESERVIKKKTTEETWPGSSKNKPGDPYVTYRSEVI